MTRALGVDLAVEPEIRDFPVEPGDVYLLCSDGLTDMVDDMEIGLILRELRENPAGAADELVQMANDGGGRDNVSVVVVNVRGDFPARAGWWRKLVSRFG